MSDLTFRRTIRIEYPSFDLVSQAIKRIEVFELRNWDTALGAASTPVISVVKREYNRGDSDVTLVSVAQMDALALALRPLISNVPIDSDFMK